MTSPKVKPFPNFRMSLVDELVGNKTCEELERLFPGWWEQARFNRNLVRKYLSREALPDLDGEKLLDLFRHMWSTKRDRRGVNNLVEEMLEEGEEHVQQVFDFLLYGSGTSPERFRAAEVQLRNMAESRISEVLWLHDRNEFPLWTGMSKEGVQKLGLLEEYDRRLKTREKKGEKYLEIQWFARQLLQKIREKHPLCRDFGCLDFVLYHVDYENRGYPEW
jgi:hypothetical protein